MDTFGGRLKQAMEAENISAKELAEKTGISEATISRYLSGQFVPKQKRTYAIATALGVDPAYLIFGTGEPPKPVEPYYRDPETVRMAQELMDNPNGRILFDASRDLSPEDIKIVLNLIQGLKAKEGK